MKTNVLEPRDDTVKVFILFVRIVVLAKQIDTRCSAVTAWSIAAHAEMRLRRVLVHPNNPNNPNTPNTSNNYVTTYYYVLRTLDHVYRRLKGDSIHLNQTCYKVSLSPIYLSAEALAINNITRQTHIQSARVNFMNTVGYHEAPGLLVAPQGTTRGLTFLTYIYAILPLGSRVYLKSRPHIRLLC